MLGSNGAGKTTVVKILSTLLKADGGIAEVDGHDVATEPGCVRGSISLTWGFAAVDEILAGQGTMVLLTAQYLDEAEHLADRIGVLHEGRVIAEGTLAELRQLFPPTEVTHVEKQPALEEIFFAIVGHDRPHTSGPHR